MRVRLAAAIASLAWGCVEHPPRRGPPVDEPVVEASAPRAMAHTNRAIHSAKASSSTMDQEWGRRMLFISAR